MNNFLKNLDLKKKAIPDDILATKLSIVVEEGTNEIKNCSIFYRQAFPLSDTSQPNINVLLLHGQRFSSKTWLDLGTIQILAAAGFRTLAIDLPGYGNSPDSDIADRGAFLSSVIDGFDLHNTVIVSPSMSGFYTLPYLIKKWKNLAGFVPVAPVGIDVLEKLPKMEDASCKKEVYLPLQAFLHEPIPDLSFIETPTMVVFGERDRSRSSGLLSLLPNSQCQEIPNGGHPAYLDNPGLWHQLMYNFLHALSQC